LHRKDQKLEEDNKLGTIFISTEGTVILGVAVYAYARDHSNDKFGRKGKPRKKEILTGLL
jgi:hypothetical protein